MFTKGTIKLNLKWLDNSDNIDWDEVSNLYKIAPLGNKRPNDLKIAFSNSMYKYFVYLNNQLVGVGRALADGVDCSYICDVAIHPDYQGKGIGKDIVNKLTEQSKHYNKIILFASSGKEEFYSKLGYYKMNTAMAIFKNHEKCIELGLISKT